jgi:hypothetical protein
MNIATFVAQIQVPIKKSQRSSDDLLSIILV